MSSLGRYISFGSVFLVDASSKAKGSTARSTVTIEFVKEGQQNGKLEVEFMLPKLAIDYWIEQLKDCNSHVAIARNVQK